MNDPFPGDAFRAALYKGQTLRVYRVSLNDPASMEAINQRFDLVAAFSLHPDFGIEAVDGNGHIYPDGTPVFVVRRKGGDTQS